MEPTRKEVYDAHSGQWWPWGQHSRNQLLAFMLWLTSKYRWHLNTYMRAVGLLDRVARTSLKPAHVPSLEYHRFLLALAAMSLAYKFEEGCPTECRWVPHADGRYAPVPSGSLWRSLVPDFNTVVALAPALTDREASNAEARLAAALDWRLQFATPLQELLRHVDVHHHGVLFAAQLLVRSCTFLTAPDVDVVGLARQLLAGRTDHPHVVHLRRWAMQAVAHPVLADEREHLRQCFPCVFTAP